MYLLFLLLLSFQQYDPVYELSKHLQLIYDPPRKDYVVYIDYRQSIDEDRLYLVDMNSKKVILKTKVSHAYNSGKKYPTKFSNKIGTKKSCVGAFLTLNSYYGKWGYSMKIKGLDYGINDNAYVRAIVFHSNIVQRTTWSEGCFATPDLINKRLIDLVKDGCLVYVYN